MKQSTSGCLECSRGGEGCQYGCPLLSRDDRGSGSILRELAKLSVSRNGTNGGKKVSPVRFSM